MGPRDSNSSASKVSNLEPNACDDIYASQKLNNLDLTLDGCSKNDAYNKFDEPKNLLSSGKSFDATALPSTNPFRNFNLDTTKDNNDCDTSDNTGLLMENCESNTNTEDEETDAINVSEAWKREYEFIAKFNR